MGADVAGISLLAIASLGARLEHLAVANNDSGGGGRLLVHDGAYLRGGVLHYIEFRLSVGSAGHDCCGCSRNKKLLHDVSSIVSVSLRRLLSGVESVPRLGTTSTGSLTFSS